MKLDNFDPKFNDHKYFHCQRTFQHPRARRPSGGIAVLIRKHFSKSNEVSIAKANEHVIWLKISLKHQPVMYVGGWYIPPQNSTSNVYGTCNVDQLNNTPETNVSDIIDIIVTNESQQGMYDYDCVIGENYCTVSEAGPHVSKSMFPDLVNPVEIINDNPHENTNVNALKIMSWNIQGIGKKFEIMKLDN